MASEVALGVRARDSQSGVVGAKVSDPVIIESGTTSSNDGITTQVLPKRTDTITTTDTVDDPNTRTSTTNRELPAKETPQVDKIKVYFSVKVAEGEPAEQMNEKIFATESILLYFLFVFHVRVLN